jgi:hypothetical protein
MYPVPTLRVVWVFLSYLPQTVYPLPAFLAVSDRVDPTRPHRLKKIPLPQILHS